VNKPTSSSAAAIRVEDLSLSYGSREVLSHIAFDAQKGDFIGVIGPNGAGKTTLLRALGGSLTPKTGAVLYGGEDIRHIGRRELSRRVAFVPQALKIPVAFTVAELVAMGRIPYLGGWAGLGSHDREVVGRVMDQTDLTELSDRPVNELSAGEQQRAVVAMALAQEPGILLLDEPTAYLDIQHTWQLLELIHKLNSTQELTVIMCLHDLNLAAEFCERLLLLERGRLAAQGVTGEVLQADILSRVYAHPVDVVTTEANRVLVVPRRARGQQGTEPS